jgi:hypothetical protein
MGEASNITSESAKVSISTWLKTGLIPKEKSRNKKTG